MKHSWIHLTSIQVGGSICLPVIMIGHLLCQHYGLWASLLAIMAGNLILLAIGLVSTSMGAKSKKSTVEHASLYFGEQGSLLFALLMVICLLGWFAIQLNSMIMVMQEWGFANGYVLTVVIGALITCLVMYGLTQMARMANVCAPLLLVTLGYALYMAPIPDSFGIDNAAFKWEGISLVMATSIATVIDLPNFFRYARSQRDGIVSSILLFGIATPLIEGIGVYLAYSLPNLSLMEALHTSETGAIGIISGLFLLCGGWITNNANLFSASVSAEKLLPKLSEAKRVALLGVVAILIALTNPAGYLEEIVNGMGIAVGSMGGVIITGHLLGVSNRHSFLSYPLCWICGVLMGYVALLTGIALLDAFLVASLMTGLKQIIETRRIYATDL